MQWTEEHEEMLCREVILHDLFQYKDMSSERGQCLDRIAEPLNAVTNIWFKVDQRSLRDKLKKLLKDFLAKKNKEERSSGINPEHTELDNLLQDILDRKNESEKNYTEATKKGEEEKIAAEDIRKRSMERLSETKERLKNNGVDDEGVEKKRYRSSGNDTISYLREKSERDFKLREEELLLKRQELEQHKERDNNMFNMISMNMNVMSKLADQLANNSKK